MKKIIFLICVSMFGATMSSAEKATTDTIATTPVSTVSEVFINSDDSSLELIDKSTRMDMCDYYLQADSIWQAQNRLYGVSEIKKMTDNFAEVSVTEVNTVMIKMLPVKSSRLIAIINTVAGPAADSDISFYNTDLQPLNANGIFKLPTLKDFFELPKGSPVEIEEISDMLEFTTMKYVVDEESNELKASLTIGEYMNEDDYNKIKPFIKDYVAYEWNGKKYVRKKE